MTEIDIQYATALKDIPARTLITSWVHATLTEEDNSRLTVRIVDIDESAVLNRQWRSKDGPTNVLSFSYDDDNVPDYLGDIVICAPVVREEAIAQGKTLEAHWAHMVIHGILHLQGHDHQDPAEAEIMEQREIHLMHNMGFDNPYAAEQ